MASPEQLKQEMLEYLNGLLRHVIKFKASDLHINAGAPPHFRINGKLMPPAGAGALTPAQTEAIGKSIMSERQYARFEEDREIDLGYTLPGQGRFRVNVYYQRGFVGLAIRAISQDIPTFESLNLPPIIKEVAENNRGLVLVTGATSSGKSTTLAAMIGYIAESRYAHIITIEDPIEYLQKDKKSLITQRELGVDTTSYAKALKAALRQDPNVILIGELRDLETMETVLTAAETGHMVFSTVHTSDASETVNRIISTFPESKQAIARIRLAQSLKAVISQRLVPRADNKGRALAAEIMVNQGYVKDLLMDPEKVRDLTKVIEEGETYGMQTFDQALTKLVHAKVVTYDVALKYATNPADFALRFQGIQMSADQDWNAQQQVTTVTSAAEVSKEKKSDDFLKDDLDFD